MSVQQLSAGPVRTGMLYVFLGLILLFVGLGAAYTMGRTAQPEAFEAADSLLKPEMGGAGVIVLLAVGLSMIAAGFTAQRGMNHAVATCLILTMVCAVLFLGVKFVEYQKHWQPALEEGREALAKSGEDAVLPLPAVTTVIAPDPEGSQLPAAALAPAGLAAAGEDAAESETPAAALLGIGAFVTIFGLHGLFVLVGILFTLVVLGAALRGAFGPENFGPVCALGLYWHGLVLAWLLMFPPIYLGV